MSPIIDLQRRMVEAGRIRAGDKGPKGEPRKLDKWRLTSKDRQRLDGAARLWGGEVRPWEGHSGEFELYTETDSLPIMLLPGHEPTTWYELWSAGGCQRRCDGRHEIVSDSSCLCGDERECKPYTRLPVLLPDLPGIGSWLVTSTGWNAAAELAGSADLLTRATAQGVLIPARLRLEQRHEIKSGKTRRFAVPVIDLDVSFRALLGAQGALLGGETPREQAALPAGYIPIASRAGNGSTLADGLATAETQTLTKPPRVPLPDDDVEDEPGAEPSPTVQTGGAGGPRAEPAPSASASSGTSSPVPDDAGAPAATGPDGTEGAPATITRAQRARLFAIGREYGVEKDHLRTLLKELTGSESTAELSVEHYDALVGLIQSRDPVNA